MSKYTVVAIGNTVSCAFCKKFDTLTNGGKLQAQLPNSEFFWADQSKDAALFNKWVKKAAASGSSAPVIAVFDSSEKLLGKFVGRADSVTPFTVSGIVKKIQSICPDCVIETDTSDSSLACGCACVSCGCKVKFCPSCGKEL